MFGAHLITQKESVVIHKQGFFYGDIVHRAIEYAKGEYDLSTRQPVTTTTARSEKEMATTPTQSTIPTTEERLQRFKRSTTVLL